MRAAHLHQHLEELLSLKNSYIYLGDWPEHSKPGSIFLWTGSSEKAVTATGSLLDL